MKEWKRALRFLLFSISAGLIEMGAFALLNETLRWPYWLSYMIALVLSVLWNFTLNRKFTFRSAANVPVAMAKVAAYYAVFTPLSSWLEHVYTMQWGWNEYPATFTNMVLNLVTEFLYQRYFVFGKSIDTQAGKTIDESLEHVDCIEMVELQNVCDEVAEPIERINQKYDTDALD